VIKRLTNAKTIRSEGFLRKTDQITPFRYGKTSRSALIADTPKKWSGQH
jgi:hypothetical protein